LDKRAANLKNCVLVAALLPLVFLVLRSYLGELTANPIEYVSQATGWWTLCFLSVTLAITPIRKLFKFQWIFPLRRLFGLIAFFYACVHLATWVVLDQFFDFESMLLDIKDRPYITIGMSAFVITSILAYTSRKSIRLALGPQRWVHIHRLIYVIAILGVTHFYLIVKRDTTEPLVFAAIIAVLLAARFIARQKK
jgi:sulfoxide reductase heme-binding subunit YedZ